MEVDYNPDPSCLFLVKNFQIPEHFQEEDKKNHVSFTFTFLTDIFFLEKCRIHYLIYFYYDLLLLIFPLYLYCLFLFLFISIIFILVFFTSFFCLDRWSIPSRQFSILWSYLDIILLFSSYLYFLLIYFMFIFFLFTSGVFWKSIHFEVASDSFSLLINSSWLLVFAIILFVLIFPYIFYLNIFYLYFWSIF